MANLLFINTKATDRSTAASVPACAAGNPVAMLVGENSIVRYRGKAAAGEINAFVARCVL